MIISIEEAHKINDFLDGVFKFKVGDFVQHAALGEFVEDPTGIGCSTRDSKSWTYSLSYNDRIRLQVVERWLQQCHGGVQKHYHLRVVGREGVVDKTTIQVTEQELVLSSPFRAEKTLTVEEIRAYPDKNNDRKK